MTTTKISRTALLSAFLGLGLISSASAQVDISKMLQGLTTGNQNEDQKLQEAYSRGYRNGMRDARQGQGQRRSDDRDDYRDERRSEPTYRDTGPQGYNHDRDRDR